MKKRIGQKPGGNPPAKKKTLEPRPPRLQQVLASAGLGSRRLCESLIVEGRVEVDGQIADKLGTRVDPDSQAIFVDGEPVKVQRPQYFMLNKPVGVVCTSRDPSGRIRVIDMIRADARIYSVGRLDRSSEGLILVTNDGDLANRLTHPSFQIEKRYLVEVVGVPEREQLAELEKGVHLAEGLAKAKSIRPKRTTQKGTILEIVLNEGRNREIRRLLARIGHKVLRLKRIAIGPILLGELSAGQSRRLSSEEVAALKGLSRKKKQRSTTDRKNKELIEQSMVTEFRGRIKKRKSKTGEAAGGKTRSPGRAVSRQKPAGQSGSDRRGAEDRAPKRGAARNQSPRGGAPRSGSPRSGSPRSGSPRSGSPRSGSPRSGSPRSGAPRSGSPRSGSPRSGAPRSGSPRSGSDRSGSARSGSPRSGADRKGPPRRKPGR